MITCRILAQVKLKVRSITMPTSACSHFSTDCNNSADVKYQEVKIPVPWGHIAGKWWGPQNKRPVLVLHGWQDNCGSFDRLIPLLPKHLGYLAIDLPGHGLSSHLPPGLFYHFMNGPISVKHIKDHFQWPKISLIGHSLGSIISFTYSSLFPDTVDFLVCMDALSPLVFKKRLDTTIKSMNDFSKYNDIYCNSKKEPPAYTQEEMAILVHNASRKSVNVENAKYILERNTRPSTENPGKFYISRDIRLKVGSLMGWTVEDCVEAGERVKFPLFLSIASKTIYNLYENQKASILQVMEAIKKNNADTFEFVNFEGTHHVHLNDPVQVAEKLSEFIRKHDNEVREDGIGDIRKCIDNCKM